MQIVGERGLNALLPDTDKLKQTDLVFTQSLISGTIISQTEKSLFNTFDLVSQ